MGDSINKRISEIFVLLKVGKYDEPLWSIMTRIKREMDLESSNNPKSWYPFAYRQNFPDYRIREHLETWKRNHDGNLPPRIDVLFCPVDGDKLNWEKKCKHRIPPRPDISSNDEPRAWRYMNMAVDGSYEKPSHYGVWGIKAEPYYAGLIEDLELYPYDRMETLELAYCRHYPKTKRIGRPSMFNIWTKAEGPEPARNKDLSIIGRAVLREPYGVELLPKPLDV
jgi:hypothetical protein